MAAISVTATGTSGSAVTLTLPANPASFHYIDTIQITRYAAVAIVGTATPIVVTTTNIPGNLAFTFATALALGSIDSQSLISPSDGLKSTVINTNTTIVCPATTSVIWRVNVLYRLLV
jgi:hypothetical protein